MIMYIGIYRLPLLQNQNGNIKRKQKKIRNMQNDIVDLSIYIIYMYVIILQYMLLF